jgi:hypothetical protein
MEIWISANSKGANVNLVVIRGAYFCAEVNYHFDDCLRVMCSSYSSMHMLKFKFERALIGLGLNQGPLNSKKDRYRDWFYGGPTLK